MTKTFLLLLFFTKCTNGFVFGQVKNSTDPLKEFLLWCDNSIPQTINKIVYDFNGDGLADLAFSSSATWSNAGGTWRFYFKNTNNTYYYYDALIVMHGKAYAVKKEKTGANVLIVYQSSNCCSGGLCFFSVTPKGFRLTEVKNYGEKEKISTLEQLNKELSKGKTGIWTQASLNCLMLKEKNCWH